MGMNRYLKTIDPNGVLVLQEFNIEKLQLVEAEKKKIKQEYERKGKQVEVRKKMWVFYPPCFPSSMS